MLKKTIGLVVIMLVVAGGVAWGAVPPKINFQGILTNADGTHPPKPTLFEYSFDGSIYNEASEAQNKFSYDPATGVINAVLDQGFTASNFDKTQVYFRLDDTKVFGPQEFSSVPYALKANVADSVQVAQEALSMRGITLRDRVSLPRVGIGNKYNQYFPWHTLDINSGNEEQGGLRILNSSKVGGIWLENTTSGGVEWFLGATGSGGYLNADAGSFTLLRKIGTMRYADLCITKDGNVGLGVWNPEKKLDVKGAIGCDSLVAETSLTAKQGIMAGTDIICGGSLGVGTWSLGNSKLVVKGTVKDYIAQFNNDYNGFMGAGIRIQCGKYKGDDLSGGKDSLFIMFCDGDGSGVGSIYADAEQVWYSKTSDQRVKKDIRDTRYGLKDLMKIKVRDFRFKDLSSNSPLQTGFIAQELEKVYPSVVGKGQGPEDMMTVDYGSLTPLLVKAVQELKMENDKLKARIEALEAK